MAEQVLTSDSDPKLRQIMSSVANAMADTLQTLVDRPVLIKQGSLAVVSPETLTAKLDIPGAVAVGSLDRDDFGHFLRFLLDGRDAMTLSSLMMMASDEEIIDRRFKGTLGDEDLENLVEICNVLCSGVDTLLSDKLSSPIGLRGANQGIVLRDGDNTELLGDGPLVSYTFPIQISSYPKTEASILLDKDTAERWIEQPIRMDPPEVEAPAAAETPKPWIKEIPQAPIRGKLSCYAIEEAVFDVVSASCRRIGLEIARRPAAEVPNPSVHKDEIVAVEVPIGDDRRFEWCKRLKSNQPTARVVMLMQHPSRPRVLQGLLAKADVIVGLPVEEPQLSEKLAGLLEPAPDSPHK